MKSGTSGETLTEKYESPDKVTNAEIRELNKMRGMDETALAKFIGKEDMGQLKGKLEKELSGYLQRKAGKAEGGTDFSKGAKDVVEAFTTVITKLDGMISKSAPANPEVANPPLSSAPDFPRNADSPVVQPPVPGGEHHDDQVTPAPEAGTQEDEMPNITELIQPGDLAQLGKEYGAVVTPDGKRLRFPEGTKIECGGESCPNNINFSKGEIVKSVIFDDDGVTITVTGPNSENTVVRVNKSK